jgi:hypothetical protein
MVEPQSVLIAAGQLAASRYLTSSEYRKDRRRMKRSVTGRRSRRAALRWLTSTAAESLVLSQDHVTSRAAEESLRGVLVEAGGNPDEARSFLLSARQFLEVHYLTGVDAARRANLEQDDRLEQRLGDLQEVIERLPDRDPATRGARLPWARIERLVSGCDTQLQRRIRHVITEVPTRKGYEQFVADVRAELGAEVVEALALYAAVRRWFDLASNLFEFAAGRSAHPERLLARAAWHAHHAGDGERVRHLRVSFENWDSPVGRAICAAVAGDEFEDELTGTVPDFLNDPDAVLLTYFAVEALSRAGRNETALRLVEQALRHEDGFGLRVAELELRRLLALDADVTQRDALLRGIASDATELRAAVHEHGLPAPGATRTLVLTLIELNEYTALSALMNQRWVRDEVNDVEVAGLLAMAFVAQGGTEEGIGVELNDFYRAYFKYFPHTLEGRPTRPPSDEELERLLVLASNDTELVRALLLMAHCGRTDESRVNEVRRRQPDSAAVIEAAHLAAHGRHDEAAAVLRPHAATSAGAASQLALTLNAYGRVADAVDAALDVWENFADTALLVWATERLADMPKPPLRVAERLRRAAGRASQGLDDERRGMLLEGLFVINMNTGRPEHARDNALSLRALVDTPHAAWRLITAEWALGNRERSWELLSEGDGLLAPRTDFEVQLAALLADSAQDGHEYVPSLLEMSDRASDPDVRATVLLACQRLVDRHPSPGELGRETWDRINAFADRYPDSPVIQRFEVDPNDPIAAIRLQMRDRDNTDPEVSRLVTTGQFPLTFAAPRFGRTPASVLNSRSNVPLHAASQSLLGRQRDRSAAEAALHGEVVLDLTAAHVLGLLHTAGGPDLARFFRLVVPASAAHDALSHTHEPLSVGTFVPTGDPSSPVTLLDFTDEERRRQGARQQALAHVVGLAVRRPDPDSVSLLGARGQVVPTEHLAWLPMELAKRTGIPLWCDDAATRVWARREGIATFSTRSVADVLHRSGALQDEEHVQLREVLRASAVMDLPSRVDEFVEIASRADVGPDVTLQFRQPAWWRAAFNVAPGRIQRLLDVVVEVRPDEVATWIANMAVGLSLHRPDAKDVPARLVLYLLMRYPDLQHRTDEVITAVEGAVWCVPATLGDADLVRAADYIIDQTQSQDITSSDLLTNLLQHSERWNADGGDGGN